MQTALTYRNKAEELRTLAEHAETEVLKIDLMAIAQQYESLANEAEKRPPKPQAAPPIERADKVGTNFVFSVERNTLQPVGDPSAYAITVTRTFLPPRATTRYEPAGRGAGHRQRSQGIAKGLAGVEAELALSLSGSGLKPKLIYRSGTVWVRLERATGSAE